MNLKTYYQKLRQVEAGLTDAQIVVVSLSTPDGGRAGMLTEVPRELAAKLIVEGSARQADEKESTGYREQMAEARQRAEQLATANRIQVTVVAESPEANKKQKAKTKNPQE